MSDVQELNINNSTYDIKAKSVVDTNSGKVKMWTGTKAQYDAIVTKDADTLYNVTDDTEDPTKVRCRSIGEIVTSTIPIVDAGLHLLDGALLNGSGSYGDFVDYIAGLYSENETTWTQPVLTSNGTLGGNRFAVYASNNYDASAYPIYMSFDNNSSTIWYSSATPVDVIFYNPEPLKVTNIQCQNRTDASSYAFTAGAVYGSNDNVTYTEISTFTNNDTSQGGTWNINLSNNTNFYLYYKVSFSSATQTGVGTNFTITATYLDTPNYFIKEEAWQALVATYGVCGKFVYDSVANTVRLPKVTGIIEGTTDVSALGDLVEAGLPNITGDLCSSGVCNYYNSTGWAGGTANKSGAVEDYGYPGERSQYLALNGGSEYTIEVRKGSIDASRSSSIYGNSLTVQPQTIKAFYYIVIANSTKTEIQSDIDEIATDLNGKADVDLTNCTNVANIKIAHNAMPSNTYVDLTLGASGATYTAPADGWYYLNKVPGSDFYYICITVRDISNNTIYSEWTSDYRTSPLQLFIPVKKGNNILVTYNATGATNYFRFIYAVGSESEAS